MCVQLLPIPAALVQPLIPVHREQLQAAAAPQTAFLHVVYEYPLVRKVETKTAVACVLCHGFGSQLTCRAAPPTGRVHHVRSLRDASAGERCAAVVPGALSV